MLKHRLLLQLHCYVYLVANSRSPQFLNFSSTSSNPRPISAEPTSSFMGDVEFSLQTIISPSDTSGTPKSEVGSLPRMTPSPIESATSLFSHLNLSESEIESILRVPAARNLDDLKLFARLCPYFDGRRHLEDIMYYENVRRSQLLALIDKFRDVIVVMTYEDAAVAQLLHYPYTTTN